ncbi:Uncharacterized protein OBRU01_15127, partial [Operophtera brumata]
MLGVPGNCAEAMYPPDSTGEDQTYINHINDNFYTKFKIDPNELYTFHDSDVIAGEVTVSHTEDALVFPEDVEDKPELVHSPTQEEGIAGAFTNGHVNEIKKNTISNGHYNSVAKPTRKDVKTLHTKAQKAMILVKEVKREPISEARVMNDQSPKVENCMSPPSTLSINSNSSNAQPAAPSKQAPGETFLDVFKREQGLVEDSIVTVKTEPLLSPPPPPPMKAPSSPPKKTSSADIAPGHTGAHQEMARAGRRALWSAELEGTGLRGAGQQQHRPLCIEEIAAESRSARLDFRREAMRKRLDTVSETLRLAKRHTKAKALCTIVKTVNHLLAMRGLPSLFTSDEKRKLREGGWSGGESGSSVITEICSEDTCTRASLPCGRYCLAHITLAPEQRLYASCAAVFAVGSRCNYPLLPLKDQLPLCAEHAWKRYCLAHITHAPEQRLYASCAAVFAVGSRCNYPLLPLKDQLPLCAEHAWKRDNYDKLIRDNKPKK